MEYNNSLVKFLLEADDDPNADVESSINTKVDGSNLDDNSEESDNNETVEDSDGDGFDDSIDSEDDNNSESEDNTDGNIDDTIESSDQENYKRLKLLESYNKFYAIANSLYRLLDNLENQMLSDTEYELLMSIKEQIYNVKKEMEFIIKNTFENEEYSKLLLLFINYRTLLKMGGELIQKFSKLNKQTK